MATARLAVLFAATSVLSASVVFTCRAVSAQTTLPPRATKSCCKNDNCGGKVIVTLDDDPTDGCSISFWGYCTGTCSRCNGSVSKYTCYYIDDEDKTCVGISQNPYFACGVKVDHACVDNGGGGVIGCCPPQTYMPTTTTNACSPAECEIAGDSSTCPN